MTLAKVLEKLIEEQGDGQGWVRLGRGLRVGYTRSKSRHVVTIWRPSKFPSRSERETVAKALKEALGRVDWPVLYAGKDTVMGSVSDRPYCRMRLEAPLTFTPLLFEEE